MLPKTQHPIFPITQPSTNKKLNFRRFLGKEEKILLIAKASDEKLDKLLAMKQVVSNCSVDDIDVDALTTFDLDYIFLKLRSQSVDNIIEMRYTDLEDDEEYVARVDLEKVDLSMPVNPKMVVDVDGNIKINMRYLTVGDMISIAEEIEKEARDNIENEDYTPRPFRDMLLVRSIASVYDKDSVYEQTDYTIEELLAWLDELPLAATAQLDEFFESIPELTYTTSYKTKAGTVREIELRGIDDFFTL